MLAILAGARRAGIAPLPLGQLHTIAYFADAMAPVWQVSILDAHLLKLRSGPFAPPLQADIDHLVGIGVVTPTHVEHVRDEDGTWRLGASYELNDVFAAPIFQQAMTFAERTAEMRFVEEVVLAVSSLSPPAIEAAVASDASYGDVEVATDGLVDISQDGNEPNLSARVALRFGELMRSKVTLSPAEMVHLYVRELDKRLHRVA